MGVLLEYMSVYVSQGYVETLSQKTKKEKTKTKKQVDT